MSKSACASTVELGLKNLPGVLSAKVSLLTEAANVRFDERIIGTERLLGAVEEMGFAALLRDERATSSVGNHHVRLEVTGMTCSSCSGAVEAALQGINAIALSQFYGPRMADQSDKFEASRVHGVSVVRAILKHATWEGADYRTFFNVNFPPVGAADVLGTKVVRQGRRPNTRFKV